MKEKEKTAVVKVTFRNICKVSSMFATLYSCC